MSCTQLSKLKKCLLEFTNTLNVEGRDCIKIVLADNFLQKLLKCKIIVDEILVLCRLCEGL
jgi:hypothetical protein